MLKIIISAVSIAFSLFLTGCATAPSPITAPISQGQGVALMTLQIDNHWTGVDFVEARAIGKPSGETFQFHKSDFGYQRQALISATLEPGKYEITKISGTSPGYIVWVEPQGEQFQFSIRADQVTDLGHALLSSLHFVGDEPLLIRLAGSPDRLSWLKMVSPGGMRRIENFNVTADPIIQRSQTQNEAIKLMISEIKVQSLYSSNNYIATGTNNSHIIHGPVDGKKILTALPVISPVGAITIANNESIYAGTRYGKVYEISKKGMVVNEHSFPDTKKEILYLNQLESDDWLVGVRNDLNSYSLYKTSSLDSSLSKAIVSFDKFEPLVINHSIDFSKHIIEYNKGFIFWYKSKMVILDKNGKILEKYSFGFTPKQITINENETIYSATESAIYSSNLNKINWKLIAKHSDDSIYSLVPLPSGALKVLIKKPYSSGDWDNGCNIFSLIPKESTLVDTEKTTACFYLHENKYLKTAFIKGNTRIGFPDQSEKLWRDENTSSLINNLNDRRQQFWAH